MLIFVFLSIYNTKTLTIIKGFDMIIGSINEQDKEEIRCCLTPPVVKRLVDGKHAVLLEKKFGMKAGFDVQDYISAGAEFLEKAEDVYQKSQIILQVLPPELNLLNLLKEDQLLAADFSNFEFAPVFGRAAFLRLERVARISVAQSIDILSSQNTVRGYAAAIYALGHLRRMVPQLMTAAAMVKAAQALVIGAGVTGLQAASVLKRAGCRVTILDIVEANRELAKSVGADFFVAQTPEELTGILNGKNILIAAAGGANGSSSQIVSAEQLRFLARNAVIIDTTAQNIGINDNTSAIGSRRFYRNKYIERSVSLTASELWASNMYNLIELIKTPSGVPDLSLDYIASMVYRVPLTGDIHKGGGQKSQGGLALTV